MGEEAGSLQKGRIKMDSLKIELTFTNIILFLFCIIGTTSALDISFCSRQNTGESNGPNFWQFQSNGHCQDTCKDNFAYAVLQGNNCWCSNFAPYQQVDNSECNVPCPGFPSELCGNQGEALYGYYHLNIVPSGTLGAPTRSSQAPRPPPPDPTTVTSTVLATVTTSSRTPTTSDVITTVRSQTSSVIQSTTSTTSTTATAATTATTANTYTVPPTPTIAPRPPTSAFTPTPSTIVTTVQGSQITVTVTPTAPPQITEDSSTSAAPVAAPDPFWSDTGKVAGTFTAVAVIILALLGGVAFFLWKRRRSSDSVAINSVSDHDGYSTNGAFFVGEKRHSRLGLAGAAAGRGGSDERTTTLATPGSMSRRTSQPLVHDQRLNPNALYAMGHDNGSHVSVGSFQDDRDYSRPVLHVRNPDST